MKGLTRKIFTSVLALVLTGVALGTGVFAWFTINNTATASNFGGQLEAASGGFMVSLDGETWATSISLEEVGSGVTFGDLSTTDGINFVNLDGTPGTGSYVSFDLYFAAGDFTSINATLEITSDETSWLPDYQGYSGEALKEYASNAVRVSFVQNSTLVNIFEKAAGEDGNTAGIGEFDSNTAVEYYNQVTGGITSDNFGKVGSENSIYLNEDFSTVQGTGKAASLAAAGEGVTLPNVDGYTHYAMVTVNVWIEGWDQEAYNAILSGKININFSFKAV